VQRNSGVESERGACNVLSKMQQSLRVQSLVAGDRVGIRLGATTQGYFEIIGLVFSLSYLVQNYCSIMLSAFKFLGWENFLRW
jgi:hypothetical protein